MHVDFCWIVVNEMPDPMAGNAPQFGPFAERADGWLPVLRENPGEAEAVNVGELAGEGGRDEGYIHPVFYHQPCPERCERPNFPKLQIINKITSLGGPQRKV